MSGNLFAFAQDGNGNRIAEFIGPENALTKDADPISQGLYFLSETIIRGMKPDSFGGILGGRFGYATDYENDVFRLRYDRQDGDCSCGFDKLAKQWHKDHPHSSECYYTRRTAAIDAWDKEHKWDEAKGEEWHRLYKERNKFAEATSLSLCRELEIPWNKGWRSSVHCTCGVDALAKEWFSKNDHVEPCEIWWMYQPLFIHRRTGLEISWYKWIGRDMKMNRDSISGAEWSDILRECYESLPLEAREKAEAEHAYENTPEYKKQEKEAQKRMMEVMFHPAKYRCPIKKRTCDSCGKEYEYQEWATIMAGPCDECAKKVFSKML